MRIQWNQFFASDQRPVIRRSFVGSRHEAATNFHWVIHSITISSGFIRRKSKDHWPSLNQQVAWHLEFTVSLTDFSRTQSGKSKSLINLRKLWDLIETLGHSNLCEMELDETGIVIYLKHDLHLVAVSFWLLISTKNWSRSQNFINSHLLAVLAERDFGLTRHWHFSAVRNVQKLLVFSETTEMKFCVLRILTI